MVIRAFALNAKTYTITHEIPFESCQVTCALNGVSSWSMKLPVSYASPLGVELLTAENLATNKSLIAIVDGGNTIMVGLVEAEDGEIDEENYSVTIGGSDAGLGYLSRRLWIAAKTTYTNIEQFTIAANIVTGATTLGLGPSGITMSYSPTSTSGVLRTRTYSSIDRKFLFELFDELANVENGFEYTTAPGGSYASGFFPGILVGYPTLLRKTNLTLALGKNIKKLSYKRDGSRYANVVNVGGANKSDTQLIATAVKASDLATYPYYMATESRSTVTDQTTLQGWADRYLKLYGNPPTQYDVELNPDDPDCQVGSFRCGDEFRLIASKGRLAVDSLFRVSQWSLGVGSDGERSLSMSLFETGTI